MKDKVLSHIEDFLRGETLAGLLLMGAAVLALVAANSPIADLYDAFLALPVSLGVGPYILAKPVILWINDGLMAVFFLLVGLEIKREVVAGELSNQATAALPVVAAIGGMLGPALVYFAVNRTDTLHLEGWAIPTATDIAFALGILALVGRSVPASLKILLTALAVIDDLGAIAIIALFYTADLSVLALAIAAVCVVALFAANRLGVRALWVYILIGLVLWVSVLKSGVHATMAGVVTALAIPASALGGNEDDEGSPLTRLEHALHPYVTFFVLPLFAFANAGVALANVSRDALFHPVTAGIVLGLFIGKQAGVLTAMVLARRLGLVRFPPDVTARQIYGVAVLTGVGFTMSLFIGTLAFPPPLLVVEVKVGVLCGSLLSGLLGYILLRRGSSAVQDTPAGT